MAKWILSAFADEYSDGLDGQLEVLAKGIDCLEPRFVDGISIADLTEEQTLALKEKLDAIGVGVRTVGSPLMKLRLDADFEPELERARRVFRNARLLGAKLIRVFSFYLPAGKTREECREEVLEKLNRMLELAEEYGVTLCHENEADIYGESPEQCADLLNALGGRLKCVFDMGNFVLGDYKPYPDAYELLKEHIAYFHIKDALYAGAIVPPGCGEASVAELLQTFDRTTDREVVVTLEPHLQTFDGFNQLTGRTFQNPCVYESREQAFLDALQRLKKLLPYSLRNRG